MVAWLENLDQDLNPSTLGARRPRRSVHGTQGKIKKTMIKPVVIHDAKINKYPATHQSSRKSIGDNRVKSRAASLGVTHLTMPMANKRSKKKRRNTIHTEPKTQITIIDIDDQAVDQPNPGSIVDIGFKKERSTNEIQEAIEMFTDNVTIAGLQQASRERITVEKWMWRIGYVLACVGLCFTCYRILRNHLEPKNVYDDFQIYDQESPFPNITVCTPEASNQSQLRESLIIPEKVHRMVERLNLDLDAVIDLIMEIWRTNMKWTNYRNETMAMAAFQIIDATSENSPGGMLTKYAETMPKCSNVISNCSFRGEPFDCCRNAKPAFFDSAICYQLIISADLLKNASPISDDPSHPQDNGLVVNVTIDQSLVRFTDDLASDGLLLFIGPPGPALIMSQPIAIPSDADATVVLAPPKKITDSTNCRSDNDPVHLRYYQEDDDLGKTCVLDTILNAVLTITGCDLGMYGHIPNGSMPACSSRQVLEMAKRILNDANYEKNYETMLDSMSGGNSDTDVGMGNEWNKIKSSSGIQRIFKFVQQIRTIYQPSRIMKHQCPVSCERWSFRALSTSYGYIHKNQKSWEQEPNNISWTLVRIFYPESMYHVHVEVEPNPPYLAYCDIGGVMGVYLGFSAITITQFFIYGSLVVYAVVHNFFKLLKYKFA